MATTGKIPFMGFKALAIKYIPWMGFGPVTTVTMPRVRVATVRSLSTSRRVDSQSLVRTVRGVP